MTAGEGSSETVRNGGLAILAPGPGRRGVGGCTSGSSRVGCSIIRFGTGSSPRSEVGRTIP